MFSDTDILAMAREDFISHEDEQHLGSFMTGKRVIHDRIFGWAWQAQNGDWMFVREDGKSVRAAHAMPVYTAA